MGPEAGGGEFASAPQAVATTVSSPTDALTSFYEAATAVFKAADQAVQSVAVAFALGWQMAEVYRPDRRAGSRAASAEDLPGLSRLTASELQELGIFQIQAGTTKLRSTITNAGLEVPNAERLAEALKAVTDVKARETAIRDLHVKLLATLTAADFRLGKAYGLGRALADTTRYPPDYRVELASFRAATLAGWIRELASALPAHAAHPVAESLEAWSRWAQSAGTSEAKTPRKLAAQGRLWRSLLSGEKLPTDVLETIDYVHAGEGLVQRTGALAGRFLVHYWWLASAVVVLFGGGVWLIVGSGSGAAVGAGAATIFASLGITWKAIGSSLGAAAGKLEQPLWEGQLDRVIYERITPNEIVTSQRSRERSPDEPSLDAALNEPQPIDLTAGGAR